jgi:hypothetical protein
VLFLHGNRSQYSDRCYIDGQFSAPPRVSIVGLYTGPAPERLEMISQDLDQIFSDEATSKACRLMQVGSWPHYITCELKDDATRGGQWAHWNIVSGRPLPEAFWPQTAAIEQGIVPLVALVYEVELFVPEAMLGVVHDEGERERSWSEHIASPCRLFSLRVSSQASTDVLELQGCDVRLGESALQDETTRCNRLTICAHDGKVEFYYPIQGSVYTVRWWNMADRAEFETPDKEAGSLPLRVVRGQKEV